MLNLFKILFPCFKPMLMWGGGDEAEVQQTEPKALLWPGEEELRNTLTGYVSKYSDVEANRANLTPEEQAAMRHVADYAGRAPGSAAPLRAAELEMLRTLTGGYDPESSAYYKPLMAGIEQRRGRALDRLHRSYNLGGNLSSLARARATGETETAYDAEIANLMLGLQERERARRLDVLSPAMQYGQYLEEGPLRKAQALTQYDIPRQLEQSAINVGQNVLTGYNPTYYNPLDYQYFTNSGPSTGARLGSAGAGATSGALTGAYIGSVVPGIGTAVGAGVGAIGGGLAGYFG